MLQNIVGVVTNSIFTQVTRGLIAKLRLAQEISLDIINILEY